MWKVLVEIHLRPYAKCGSRCVDFHEIHIHSIIFYIYTKEFHPNRRKNLEIAGKITPTPLRMVLLSLHQILQNLQQLSGIMWRSPIQNFTKIGQERGEVRTQIHCMTYTEPIFTKLMFARQICVKNYTKLHENSTNNLAVYATSQTDVVYT